MQVSPTVSCPSQAVRWPVTAVLVQAGCSPARLALTREVLAVCLYAVPVLLLLCLKGTVAVPGKYLASVQACATWPV